MDAQSKDAASTTASQDKVSRQHGVETRLAVERIAAFAVAARPEHLTPDIRTLFKRNILDSLGCAIAALPGPPFEALREQFEEYRASGRCTLIGGGKTSADQAAFFNSATTSGPSLPPPSESGRPARSSCWRSP